MEQIQIIGVDCATDNRKVGLALGTFDGHSILIHQTITSGKNLTPTQIIINWLQGHSPTLIALDAPLGWPAFMGDTLAGHQAGQSVNCEANILFRRSTDRMVRDQIGRQPLDVGADRIARTAVTALGLLQNLREFTGDPIPLSWHPEDLINVSAIEVYPAATLSVYSIQAQGYKKQSQRQDRERIMERLDSLLELPNDIEPVLSNADVLDAVVCVLAGADYLRNVTVQPPDKDHIRKEGWIWVRSPEK